MAEQICHLYGGSMGKSFGSFDSVPTVFFFSVPSFLFKAVPVILSLVPKTSFAVVLVEGLVTGLPMERLPVKELLGTIKETHSMGNSYFCRENNAGERGRGLLPVCIGKSLETGRWGKC